MIHSMTGFASHSRDLGPVTLYLELRSVNSRYLDLGFRIVEDLRQAEPQLRELIGARLKRGKVECRLNLQHNDAAPRELSLNHGLLAQLGRAQRNVREHLPEAAALSVNDVLRWPGMLDDDGLRYEQMQAGLLELAREALDELVASRSREGAKLAEVVRERVSRMRGLVSRAEPLVPAQVSAAASEAVATMDEERIRQEVAVFAQRVDVAEELARLATHLDEVERILGAGGIAGKRLDFLMQELNREANTLGSKSFSADLTSIAVELKLYIEQMREQVQNIE